MKGGDDATGTTPKGMTEGNEDTGNPHPCGMLAGTPAIRLRRVPARCACGTAPEPTAGWCHTHPRQNVLQAARLTCSPGVYFFGQRSVPGEYAFAHCLGRKSATPSPHARCPSGTDSRVRSPNLCAGIPALTLDGPGGRSVPASFGQRVRGQASRHHRPPAGPPAYRRHPTPPGHPAPWFCKRKRSMSTCRGFRWAKPPMLGIPASAWAHQAASMPPMFCSRGRFTRIMSRCLCRPLSPFFMQLVLASLATAAASAPPHTPPFGRHRPAGGPAPAGVRRSAAHHAGCRRRSPPPAAPLAGWWRCDQPSREPSAPRGQPPIRCTPRRHRGNRPGGQAANRCSSTAAPQAYRHEPPGPPATPPASPAPPPAPRVGTGLRGHRSHSHNAIARKCPPVACRTLRPSGRSLALFRPVVPHFWPESHLIVLKPSCSQPSRPWSRTISNRVKNAMLCSSLLFTSPWDESSGFGP